MKELTVLVLIFCTVILIAYDAIIIYIAGYDASISYQLYTISKSWPIVPFAFGILFGHLFFPNRSEDV